MSDGIIALIVVASILVYAIGAGFTWGSLPEEHKRDSLGVSPGAIFALVFWPLVLPFRVGAILAARLRREPVAALPRTTARRG